MKVRAKPIWVVIVLWAICVLTILWFQSKHIRLIEHTELLRSKAVEIRESLYYERSFRNQLTDKMAEDLQQLFVLRNRIDKEFEAGWFSYDISHLMYTSDRYINDVQSYIDTELKLRTVMDQVHRQRDVEGLSDDAMARYYQLSAYLFEGIFGDSQRVSVIYRALDQLYSLSLSLENTDEKKQLQFLLHNTSEVLSSYAQNDHLVRVMKDHPFFEEVELVRLHYYWLERRSTQLVAMLSLLALILNGFFVLARRDVQNAQPLNETDFELEQPTAPVKHESMENVESKPVASYSDIVTVETEHDAESNPFQKLYDSLNHEKEAVFQLLTIFVDDHQNDIHKIRTAASEDVDVAIRAAHSLKGVGGNIGAAQLSSAAEEVETALKQGTSDYSSLLTKLQNELENTVNLARIELNKLR